MNSCGFCQEALSSLIAGFAALVSFVIVPMTQIIFASFKMIVEKIIPVKKP